MAQHNQKNYSFQIVSVTLGLLLSLYLLIQHTRLESGIQDSPSFCSFGGIADCDVVNSSHYSQLYGIPLASIGSVYFFLLLALLIAAPPKDRAHRWSQCVLGWLLLSGAAFDFIYLLVQIFALKSLCIMCLGTYVAVYAALFLCVKAAPKAPSRLRGLLIPHKNWALPIWKSGRVTLAAVSFVLWCGITVLLPAYLKQNSAAYSHVDNAVEQFFQEWKDKPVKNIEIKSFNGTFGNPASKVKIVEFSDFECPFCRKAAFTIHTVLKPFSERVHFAFKHFPLDNTCNPIPYQIHAHACKLAKLAACANRKGKFWDFHDEVFLRFPETKMKDGFDSISQSLSPIFSTNEIAECLKNASLDEELSDDVKMGTALNVRGTPSIFINGKLVTIPLTTQNLRRLIETEESLVVGNK